MPESYPVTFTAHFIKPDKDTPWFHETWPSSHMEYINSIFKEVGSQFYGRYHGSREESLDGLSLTTIYTFDDEEVYLRFTTDPYLIKMNQNREDHDLAHDIIRFT